MHDLQLLGGVPCQSVISPVTRSASRERYDLVGLATRWEKMVCR
jgi:hypothetical protein